MLTVFVSTLRSVFPHKLRKISSRAAGVSGTAANIPECLAAWTCLSMIWSVLERDMKGNTVLQEAEAGGRSHGPGPDRRAPFRDLIRANPYPVPPILDGMQQELRPSGIHDTESTKLYISNLDYDVTNTDIQLLFSEVGGFKSYSIHYDRSGRSKTDALPALKRYNNVQLVGKPLKIELVAVNLVTPAPVLVNSGRSASLPVNFCRPRPLLVNMRRPAPVDSSENIIPRRRAIINVASGSIQEKVGARESLHGGGGHGCAGNREQEGSCADKLTFADLDADLDKYRLEALKKK